MHLYGAVAWSTASQMQHCSPVHGEIHRHSTCANLIRAAQSGVVDGVGCRHDSALGLQERVAQKRRR